MNVLNLISTKFEESKKNLQATLEEYITFSSNAKQLNLGKKTVLLLCQQAESRVEMLESLEPHSEKGLIATIKHQQVTAKIHFTPEQITLQKDCLKGKIILLNSPQFQTNSIVYRSLIAAWKTFLGGKIPNGVLPKEVSIIGNTIYYSLPRNQLQLLDALLHNLKHGSTLTINIKKGSLIIGSSVALSWDDFKIINLLNIFNRK